MSLIDNLTFKCMDSNRGDVSFKVNKVTYFHIDYSLPATDFQLLMTVHIVQHVVFMRKQLVERSNDN